MGRGAIAQVSELIQERGAFMNSSRYAEKSFFEEDSEIGNQVAAGDEFLACCVGVGLTSGCDGDGYHAKALSGASKELDDGTADAGRIDNEGGESSCLQDVRAASRGRRASCDRGDEAADPGYDLHIGSTELEPFGMQEIEAQCRFMLPGGVVELFAGFPDALENGDGGGILALAEIES